MTESILPFVLPGDNVTKYISSATTDNKQVVKLGAGLRWDEASKNSPEQKVYATIAGQLTHKMSSRTFYIRTAADDGRYQPLLHDRVVGIVEDRFGSDGAGGDLYRVQIGGGHTATLSSLAFEGATKRNKPSLKPGQVVYARVAALHTHLELELSCQLGPVDIGQNLTRRDWMTDESCYGVLQGGTILRVPHDWTRRALLPNLQHVLWEELAKSSTSAPLAGEVAVGSNGWVWVHAVSSSATVLLYNIIRNSPVLTEAQTRAMIRQMVTHYKQQEQQSSRMQED
eukprot:scaffold516_cov175-Amphora_coffeaeformis.AAC.7